MRPTLYNKDNSNNSENPGGGGYSENILVGVFPGTPEKGGLRCGHSKTRGS